MKHAIQRQVDRVKYGVQLAPEYLLHPSRLVNVARGVHPGLLISLDQQWLKDLGPKTILDVGANNGQFSFAALSAFPEARLIAFEPLPQCVVALTHKMESVERFTIFPVAVGNSDSNITIHESPSSASSSILRMTPTHAKAFPWTEGGRDVKVDLRRLDTLLSELDLISPVLMKIDVQGYSMEVLQGAANLLKQCDLVVVETSLVTLYEGESTFDEVYEFMRNAGFSFAGAMDQLSHPQTDEILQVDAIFRRVA